MDNNSVNNTNKTTSKKSASVNKKKVDKKAPNNMEARKKVFIALIFIVLLLVLILVIIPLFKNNSNSEISKKAADRISEEKTFENYKLKETAITYDEGNTVFDTKIENISNTMVPNKGLNILLLDKDGNEITSIGVFLPEMQAGEEIDTKAVISEKVENIYDLKIVDQPVVNNVDEATTPDNEDEYVDDTVEDENM